ncbi:MAG: hypothetical protein ACKN9E_12740 [Microcystaceae cyanobacterium]|nr:hypothetical protein [Merismopediaceae bacterium]
MASLTLNLPQGSVTFRYSPSAAQTLKKEIDQLMRSLKTIAAKVKDGDRPEKQASMEYRYAGEVFIEVFCNPNLYPSPFAAKVLLTIRDDKIRLTTEAELPRLLEDLTQYLEQV